MMEKRQSKRPFGRGLRKILTKWASKSLSSSLSLSSPGPSAVVQQLPNAKSLSSSLASSSPGPSAVVQQLPNELVELILDHLYFDTPTLLNCALVARAWVHRSQRGIFREIILEISTSRTLLTQSFLKAQSVVKNPRLASYVQSLELHRFIEPSSSEAIIGSLHAIAASIVQHLSKLNFLRINYPLYMLRDASLIQLRFDRVLIPTFPELVSLLSCAAHLKVLNVDRDWNDGWHWHAARALNSSILQTDFANVGVDARSVGARSILLDELQFESSVWHIDMFLTWFRQDSCPFDIQNLRLLRIGSGAHTSAMLKYAGRNLRELELLESSLNLSAPA
ncbi:hypothetical protein BT96DRAFT_1024684 [Gymnopus androsaceus JB14]|uniref:F-box domain-containing protein n=1 Tax=Gymnopus androsaceus JB14 TaxID=1447944 RepID=A0A6A4GXM2_9AGAR|nr:hypothetical protein BT96DRAFT_1024684 [Gymnopus androsaceus JB14]